MTLFSKLSLKKVGVFLMLILVVVLSCLLLLQTNPGSTNSFLKSNYLTFLILRLGFYAVVWGFIFKLKSWLKEKSTSHHRACVKMMFPVLIMMVANEAMLLNNLIGF